MPQRIEFIDLAKGFCISLVVLWHVLGLALSSDAIMIMFFFRMPLYFILSGLFFKTYDGLFPFIKKKTNKLLIPFLFIFLVIIIPSIFYHSQQPVGFQQGETGLGHRLFRVVSGLSVHRKYHFLHHFPDFLQKHQGHFTALHCLRTAWLLDELGRALPALMD